MNAIKMDRLKLLHIVRENLEKHKAEYKEAVEDYKVAVLKLSAKNLKLAKTADLEEFAKIQKIPEAPQSYEPEYNRAIRMLELSVDAVIEVEEEIFNQLVLDEWVWKHSFNFAASTYKSLL